MSNAVSWEFEASRAFVDGAQSVLFLARRGESVMRCYVTLKTLVTYFGANDEADEGAASLQAYDTHRGAIQRVARHMLADHERAATRALVITTSDVFHELIHGHLLQPAAAVEVLAEAADD